MRYHCRHRRWLYIQKNSYKRIGSAYNLMWKKKRKEAEEEKEMMAMKRRRRMKRLGRSNLYINPVQLIHRASQSSVDMKKTHRQAHKKEKRNKEEKEEEGEEEKGLKRNL